MKYYLLVLISVSIMFSGCSLKTVRHQVDPHAGSGTASSDASSHKGAFSQQEYERQIASDLEEKTAMQLRLNTTNTKSKSVDTPAEVTVNGTNEIQTTDLKASAKTRSTLTETSSKSSTVQTEQTSSLTANSDSSSNPNTGWPQHLALNPVLPQVAFGWLQNGNTRYVKGKLRNDGMWQKDRNRTLAGEKPHSIVFSCSDSRVPPEVVFDQKLGEIYVVRSLGLTLDKSAIASIEYAIQQLGVKFLVVMCHDACVSVQTAAAHLQNGDSPIDYGTPALNDLIAEITPRLKEFSRMPADEKSNAWANVHGAGKDLIRKSPLLRKAIEEGRLKIAPALYDLKSGRVSWQ